MLNKFKGDVVQTHLSAEGRWIILVLRINGKFLVVNNTYGHNNNALAKNMIIQLTAELKRVREKYTNAHLIIGGDLNNTADDLMDRLPARMSTTRFNVVLYLCEHLNVVDAWRYMHPYLKEYTWSNATGSLQSRTDLLLSSHTMQFVSESAHSYAPFSDHQMIAITFSNPREQKLQYEVIRN